jgi:hypothetical protein
MSATSQYYFGLPAVICRGSVRKIASCFLGCLVGLAISGGSVCAQDPTQPPPNPCKKKNKGLSDVVSCAKRYYDKVTGGSVHLVHGSVVPGSGITGGIGYTHKSANETWRRQFDSSARISIRKYWELDSNLRLTRSENKFTDSDVTGPSGDLKINLYALVKDAPRLDFFGLGPESREQDRAVYHYREGVVGADLSKPVKRWLNLGAAAEGIWPDIIRIANPTVNSVERAFTETTAPGITEQSGFVHLAAFAGLHSPGQPEARRIDYRLVYHVYQDVHGKDFSFRRFDADLRNKFPFGKNELRVRGRLSLSETRRRQRVPFFLMETLGGSNIRGDDTLRGFRDYRFRDRDLALLQIEYLRTIRGPVAFIGFYDTGKVASSLSNFGAGRLRHTFGLGIVVVPRRADFILFRFYVGLGSGEGSHTFFGGGVTGRADRLVR